MRETRARDGTHCMCMGHSIPASPHVRLAWPLSGCPGAQEDIPRVPIVCTGNDFSTLYAPLIRDGRMEKFYWAPTREDRVGVCMGIFQHDGVNRQQVEELVDTFPGQSIDFFGALRVRARALCIRASLRDAPSLILACGVPSSLIAFVPRTF